MICIVCNCAMKVFTASYFIFEQRKRESEGSDEEKETPGKHEKKKSKKDKKKAKEKEKEKEKESSDEVSINRVNGLWILSNIYKNIDLVQFYPWYNLVFHFLKIHYISPQRIRLLLHGRGFVCNVTPFVYMTPIETDIETVSF